MIELYKIAVDATKTLDERYAALKLMQMKQRETPGNYLRTWKRNEVRKRRYEEVKRKLNGYRRMRA